MMRSEDSEILVFGDCDPAFDSVSAVFRENFLTRGEVGAAVCVYCEGQKVVDLWGGYTDVARTQPWQEDTIVCMMSVGKSMPAICALMLVDRGQLDLAARVCDYWPNFAQAGKEDMSVEQLLGGFAGLLYLDNPSQGAVLNWDMMITALEKQSPVWPPGTRGAYHSMTYGFLVGELVAQIDGRDFRTFFKEEVTRPLGVDYHFGLRESELSRVSDIIPNPDSATLNALADPESKLARAWRVMPATPGFVNSTAYREAVFPSANGHGNARAIARIYAAFAEGGALDGQHLLSRELIDKARATQWDSPCGLTERPYKYGLGFFLNKPPLTPMGKNPRNFGHPGAGGAIGIADPESRRSFSYSPNFMCGGAGVGDRCEALIQAVLG